MSDKHMFSALDIKENEFKNVKFDEIQNNLSLSINAAIDKIQQSIDDEILNEMYKIYKNTDISRVYLISEPEFKKFLYKMLPIYMEQLKNKGE